MLRFSLVLVLGVFLVTGLPATAAMEEQIVGSVTDVKGDARIIRAQQAIPIEKGLRLSSNDVVKTGEDGGVGMVLRDDTTLSLGPKSELKMSEFQFKPDEGILGMTLSLAKGTLAYISGQITKLAPGSAKIETPAGVAAVRGTELLIQVPETKKMKKAEKSK